jgi:hypothetical protein
MKNPFYYVEFIEKSDYSGQGKFPDVELHIIKDFETANEIIKGHYIQTFYSGQTTTLPNNIYPQIVTNDFRLFHKYRCVFNEDEFKSFCGLDLEVKNSRPYYYNSSIDGKKSKSGSEIFNHFKNIISKKYYGAKMLKYYETIDDRETGGSIGESFHNDGWEVITEQNEIVDDFDYTRYRAKPISFNENDIELEDKHFEWWEKLDEYWKKMFCSHTFNKEIYLGIPTKNGLRNIINITKLDITQFFLENRYGFSKEEITSEILNFISPLENLLELRVEYLDLDNIDFLKHNLKLQKLDISSNKLENITILSRLKELKQLKCSSNKIKSLFPLSNLNYLTILNCSNNEISNLVPLKEILELNLKNNPISKDEIKLFAETSKIYDFQIKI